MVELYAWLSVSETAADEDTLPPEMLTQIMADVQEILRQSGCGIRLQYMNGQPYLQTAFCSNHHTAETDGLIDTYRRIAETASGSYGVLYLRDDEDAQYHNDMQMYVFRRGTVTHGIAGDFSPCMPKLEDPCGEAMREMKENETE